MYCFPPLRRTLPHTSGGSRRDSPLVIILPILLVSGRFPIGRHTCWVTWSPGSSLAHRRRRGVRVQPTDASALAWTERVRRCMLVSSFQILGVGRCPESRFGEKSRRAAWFVRPMDSKLGNPCISWRFHLERGS